MEASKYGMVSFSKSFPSIQITQTVSWTTRRSNQSILKEISPEYWLEVLMLKLNLQSFGHLVGRTDSLEKTLMLGKIEGGRRRGWQKMKWHHQLDGHEFEQAPGVDDGQGTLECCSPWGHKESDTTEWLNRTELKEFPGGPVVRTPFFHHQGPRFNHWSGN